jgi:hypothetical protein
MDIIEVPPLTLDADTFRYKFSQDMNDELFRFAKIHQYEDRETFKESWAEWVTDTEELINQETDRLRADNYRGNIITKLFKSAKYYFCHKSMVRIEPAKRKSYAEPNREMIDLMDAFILTVYTIPPKHGFAQFCEKYEKNETDPKLKKMFKNRHYRIVREHAK